MDPLSIVRRRLREQGLTAGLLPSPAAIVGRLGAMQAQEFAEAKWSIAERMAGEPTDAEVEEAFARGEILRTHALRPTWHFVARDDIRWVLAATSHRVHQLNRYQYGQHGLDQDLLARSTGLFAERLADGEPRTRKELAADLAGIGIEAAGPRLAHIVMCAELDGLICSGPRRGKQHTYALISDRAPDAVELPREEAIVELARRYFDSHGPATLRDFCVWSSLTVGEATAATEALGEQLRRDVDDEGTEWLGGSAGSRGGPAASEAFLVPIYDELVMGYKELKVVRADSAKGIGQLQRAVVIDGSTVGSWKRILRGPSVAVEVMLFTELDGVQEAALRGTVERFGRFLERRATLELRVAAPE